MFFSAIQLKGWKGGKSKQYISLFFFSCIWILLIRSCNLKKSNCQKKTKNKTGSCTISLGVVKLLLSKKKKRHLIPRRTQHLMVFFFVCFFLPAFVLLEPCSSTVSVSITSQASCFCSSATVLFLQSARDEQTQRYGGGGGDGTVTQTQWANNTYDVIQATRKKYISLLTEQQSGWWVKVDYPDIWIWLMIQFFSRSAGVIMCLSFPAVHFRLSFWFLLILLARSWMRFCRLENSASQSWNSKTLSGCRRLKVTTDTRNT